MTKRVMCLLHVKRPTLRYILSAVGCRELVRGSPSKGSLPDVTRFASRCHPPQSRRHAHTQKPITGAAAAEENNALGLARPPPSFPTARYEGKQSMDAAAFINSGRCKCGPIDGIAFR